MKKKVIYINESQINELNHGDVSLDDAFSLKTYSPDSCLFNGIHMTCNNGVPFVAMANESNEPDILIGRVGQKHYIIKINAEERISREYAYDKYQSDGINRFRRIGSYKMCNMELSDDDENFYREINDYGYKYIDEHTIFDGRFWHTKDGETVFAFWNRNKKTSSHQGPMFKKEIAEKICNDNGFNIDKAYILSSKGVNEFIKLSDATALELSDSKNKDSELDLMKKQHLNGEVVGQDDFLSIKSRKWDDNHRNDDGSVMLQAKFNDITKLHEEKSLLNEDRESKAIDAAIKYLITRGYKEPEAKNLFDKIRIDIPAVRLPLFTTTTGRQKGTYKFAIGVERFYLNGDFSDATEIRGFNKTLELLANGHEEEYDNNFNGMSFDDIMTRFSTVVTRELENDKKAVSSLEYEGNSQYDVVKIQTFKEASVYGKYTSWCVTHRESMFDSYTANGSGLFYFFLKHGFENVPKQKGNNTPLDEYGLSMIAVCVDNDGSISTITCRWNHDNDANDNVMSTKDLSNIVGMNIYDVCKPYTEDELTKKGFLTVPTVQKKIDEGVSLDELFDYNSPITDKFNYVWCRNASTTLANVLRIEDKKLIFRSWIESIDHQEDRFIVYKKNKTAIFDEDFNLIGGEWFKACGPMRGGYFKIKKDNKYNLMDKNGKFLFDDYITLIAYTSRVGYLLVNDNKCNYLTENGLLFDKWAEGEFCEPIITNNDTNNLLFKVGPIDGPLYICDKSGNRTEPYTFKGVRVFRYGFAAVYEFETNKYNFINTNGKIISDIWFDNAKDFVLYNDNLLNTNRELAKVYLNDKVNFITNEGKLLFNVWFDSVDTFEFVGYAYAELNSETYIVTLDGKIMNKSGKKISNVNELSEDKKKPSAMSQVGNKVNAGLMDAITCGGMCEGAEPESNEYTIGFENGANSYAHVNEERGITNFSTENAVIKELINTIIKWIPRAIDEKNAVKKIETVNKDILSIRVHDDPIKKDFTNRLFMAKLKDGSMKPFIRTKYSCALPSSITKGKFAGFENLKVIINVTNNEEIRDKEEALSLIHEQYGGFTSQDYERTFGTNWNVDWQDGELYQFAKPWKNQATAGARAGKFEAKGNDGKPFSWWTKLKDGKVNWLELQINKVECVNGVPYNIDSLPGLIYHEINHEYDNYYELKRTNGGTTSLGFRHDDDAMSLNGYAQGLMYNDSNNLMRFSIGCILYVVYVPGELDAHAVQAYGDLQNIDSKRGSFNNDLKKTNAYKEYQLAVESLERLKNYKELGWDKNEIEGLIRLAPIVGEDYKWYDSNGKLNGTNVERDRSYDYGSKYGHYTDGPEKYKNREDPEIEAKYANIKPAKKSLVSKSSTLESFIAQSEKRLNKLFKKMGRVSSLYYDESEKETEATALNEAIERNFDYKKYMKQIAEYMNTHGLTVKPYPTIKLDNSEQDGLFIKTGYYEPEKKRVVLFVKDRHPKDILRSFAHEMIHHAQNLRGDNLSFSGSDNVKDNEELEKLESEAYLKGNIYFRKWTEYFSNGKNELLNESLNEIKANEIDLSSFKIKRELNPKFWIDGHLDKRIRLKLLDIADDFIKYLNVDWIDPKDILMTGSLANYNWNKKYSDIDLHILVDFEDVDDNVDFVRSYFTAKKDLWNSEHEGIKVYGFPVEVYVQDVKQKHNSTGIYSLDKDKWIEEPEFEKLNSHKIDAKVIKKEVAKFVNKIDALISDFKELNGDTHKAEVLHDKANKLFDEIKNKRYDGFSKDESEMNSGNLIFKTLRRLDYIGKLCDLREKTYDIVNSLK